MNEGLHWMDHLFAVIDEYIVIATAYLPTLLSAIVLLLVGWLIARGIRAIVLRIGSGIANVMHRTGFDQRLHFVRLPWPLSVICATTLYWLVLLVFLSAAASLLGMPGVGAWIDFAVRYAPKVLASGAIVLLAYALASFARDTFGGGARDASGASTVGQALFYGINSIGVLVAADELGVDVTLLQNLIVIMVAAMFGGIAFAFGLGAGSTVDNIIAGYYLRRIYRVGQRVRVGEAAGVILEITPTAVMLDTGEGRALVPARVFGTSVSVLVEVRSPADGQ